MALTPNLVFTAVSADGTSFVVTDSTVYGAPNQDRADVAVFVTAYRVDEDLVETAETVTTFLPASATSFTITIATTEDNGDGWHKVYFVIIDDYDNAVTYEENDLVFYSDVFYKYINSTPDSGNLPTDTVYWETIADPTSVIQNVGTADESENISYQVLSKIIDYQTARCFSTLACRDAKENCGEDCGCDGKDHKTLIRVRGLLTAMRIDDAQELYLKGEKAARTAENYCDDCGCLD